MAPSDSESNATKNAKSIGPRSADCPAITAMPMTPVDPSTDFWNVCGLKKPAIASNTRPTRPNDIVSACGMD